jgi:hypothetical protein
MPEIPVENETQDRRPDCAVAVGGRRDGNRSPGTDRRVQAVDHRLQRPAEIVERIAERTPLCPRNRIPPSAQAVEEAFDDQGDRLPSERRQLGRDRLAEPGDRGAGQRRAMGG